MDNANHRLYLPNTYARLLPPETEPLPLLRLTLLTPGPMTAPVTVIMDMLATLVVSNLTDRTQ